jgi:phospholipase/lecithinase/hemolysin
MGISMLHGISFSVLTHAALMAIALLKPVAASPYSTIYSFGDSLSDAGNIYTITFNIIPRPPYSNGRFTNGPVWVQDLSSALGLGPVLPSLLGGNDFAFGGAETGTTLVHIATPFDLPSQLSMFQKAVSTPTPGALYTLWIGSNDLLDILSSSLSPTEKSLAEMQTVDNIDSFIEDVAQDGAHNLLLLTVPDLGKTPKLIQQGPTASLAASSASFAFNQLLLTSIEPIEQTFDLNLITVDTFSPIDQVVDDPAGFGFTNVTAPCWSGDLLGQNGTLCAQTTTDQDNYLFWDDVHPTAHGHQLVADAVVAAIPEPPVWAILGSALSILGALFWRNPWRHLIAKCGKRRQPSTPAL